MIRAASLCRGPASRLPSLALALFALGALPAGVRADGSAPEAGPPIRAVLDVPYAPGGERHDLDVFSPADARDCPVVLFVHGGAWVLGDKDLFGLYRSVGRFLARHGIVAVLMNYDLGAKGRHPRQVMDVARAFAWVRRNVGKYGGDPDRIVLVGHSAGGQLVSLLATDPRYLKDPSLDLTDRDRAALKGVVAVCGVYQIPSDDQVQQIMGVLTRAWMTRRTRVPVPALAAPAVLRYGKGINPVRLVFGAAEAVRRAASPLTHVHPGLPPFLLLSAQYEMPYLADQAVEFARALREAGDAVDLHRLAGTDHDTIVFHLRRPNDPVAPLLLKFIATYAGKAEPASK